MQSLMVERIRVFSKRLQIIKGNVHWSNDWEIQNVMLKKLKPDLQILIARWYSKVKLISKTFF